MVTLISLMRKRLSANDAVVIESGNKMESTKRLMSSEFARKGLCERTGTLQVVHSQYPTAAEGFKREHNVRSQTDFTAHRQYDDGIEISNRTLRITFFEVVAS